MPPHLVEEFYQQGLSSYRAGQTLKDLAETTEAVEAQEEAEHIALDQRQPGQAGHPDHQAISQKYRGASQSLITGFADGVIADIRRAANAGRGQRA